MRILMVGLDAAGKTTILYKLKLGEGECRFASLASNGSLDGSRRLSQLTPRLSTLSLDTIQSLRPSLPSVSFFRPDLAEMNFELHLFLHRKLAAPLAKQV